MTQSGFQRVSTWWIVVTALAVCLAVWRDCSFLFQSSVATGIDGYYYVLQTDTLRNEGHFYFPTSAPLVLCVLTALSYVTRNPVLAIKIGAVMLHLLLTLGVMVLITDITRNAWSGLCGMVITSFSGLHLYLITEFISNLGALVFLVWGAWLLIQYARTKKPIWLMLSVLFLLAAIYSHRSILGLMILSGFTIFVAYLLTSRSFSSRSTFWTLAIVLILFILPLILARQRFIALPQQLDSELLKIPKLPLRPVDLAESWMLIGAVIGTIFVCFRRRHRLLNKTAGLFLVSVTLSSLLLTLNPFLNHQTGVEGIVGRLGIISYLQVAIVVPILLSELFFEVSKTISLVMGLLFLLLLTLSCAALFAPIPLSLRTAYLQNRESLVAELIEMRAQLCEKPFIVARHGDQFLVTAVLGIPAQKKPPLERQQCIYWLIHQPQTVAIVGVGTITTPKNDFVLVEDKSLKEKIASLNPQQYRLVLTANPHLREVLGFGVQ